MHGNILTTGRDQYVSRNRRRRNIPETIFGTAATVMFVLVAMVVFVPVDMFVLVDMMVVLVAMVFVLVATFFPVKSPSLVPV